MPSVAIVGIGRLGGALSIALSRNRYQVEFLVHRDLASAQSVLAFIEPRPILVDIARMAPITTEVVIITTPDPEIKSAAETICSSLAVGSIVLHTSGSLSSEILEPLRDHGLAIGSIHPLVSVSDAVVGAKSFGGAYFCVEGDGAAVEAATKIATALGGSSFSIETNLKPLYHASAVMASGHFTALEDMAIDMLTRCGVSIEESKRILMPLVKTTVQNLETQPIEFALTGTFARVDADAFERHLASFTDSVSDDIREVYLLLAGRSLELAAKAGAERGRIDDLRKRIDIAKENRQ